MAGNNEETEGFVLRVRGLPWSTTKEEIQNFFSKCNIKDGLNGIHMTLSREGRPSGEAYIELESEQDVELGLQQNNQHMGHRYIEGLEIVPNGITLPTDYQGRSTGEAFVQFASRDIAEKAMGKHKEKIGHRYIEIFKSSLQEIRSAVGMGMPKMMRPMGTARPGPYDRGDRFGGPSRYAMGRGGARTFRGFVDDDSFGDFGRGPMGGRFGGGAFDSGSGGGARYAATGHFVHMRGLPFRATEQDIFEFFRPMSPINVHLIYEDSGRPSGECDVEFASHEEAVKAMSKDKAHMQHRYIELFLNSTPSGLGGANNSGGGASFGNGVGPIGSGPAASGAFSGTMTPGGTGFGAGRYGGGSGAAGNSYYSTGMGGMGSGTYGTGSMIGGNNYTSF